MEIIFHAFGLCSDHMFHLDIIDLILIFINEQNNTTIRYINHYLQQITKLWLG
jgi:hypothetical protein